MWTGVRNKQARWWMLHCLGVAVLLVWAGMANAAEHRQRVTSDDGRATVEVSIQNAELFTIDELDIVVDVTGTGTLEDVSVEFESLDETQWTQISKSIEPLKAATPSSASGVRVVLTIEPYLPGTVELPPLIVSYSWDGDGEHDVEHTLATTPMEVTIRSVLDDPEVAELAGLKSVVDPPKDWRVFLWIGAVGAIVMCALILLAWKLLRKGPVVEPTVRLAAHDVAIARLDELQQRDLIGKGMFKQFYLGVSYVLRQYIEDRFRLRAPEQTTEEFLDASRKSGAISGDDLQTLERFLAHCDEVKFAGMRPTVAQAEAGLNLVRSFIVQTRSEDAHRMMTQSQMQEQNRRADRWLAVAHLDRVPHQAEGGAR